MSYPVLADVFWLNGQDDRLFLIDGDVLSLYDVEQDENKSFCTSLVCTSSLFLGTSKQDYEFIRCVALDHSLENYIALGFNSGRISITKADVDTSVKGFSSEDFRDAQKKSIACFSWHFYDNNKFSTAGRGVDHTVVVYDLSRGTRNTREVQSTTFEANLSEKVYGISWFKDDANLIIVSTPRCLRLADIRERNGFQTTVNVQTAQLGVCTEPNVGYRVACHSRNTIFVFDRRFLTFPIHEIPLETETHSISRLSWHPTQKFHLSCVARDMGNFYNFSISSKAYSNNVLSTVEKHGATLENLKQSFEHMSSEYKYLATHRSIPGYSRLSSFDWHPTIKHRLALLCSSRSSSKKIQIVKEQYDILSTISNYGELAFSSNFDFSIAKRSSQVRLKDAAKSQPRFAQLNAYFKEPDMTTIMRKRISNGYGYGSTSNTLSTIIEKSRNAIENDCCANPDLKFCWRWVDRMYQASELCEYQKLYYTNFPGIKHIIKDMKSISSTKQDEVTYRNRIFMNEKRERMLKICGWPSFEDHAACKLMLDEMMSRKTIQSQVRAAALALFLVQGATCKQYLQELCKFIASDSFMENNNPDFTKRYLKMAQTVTEILSKFNGIKVPDYEMVCREITDSYFLAMIKFLARREGYNTVHNEIMALKHIELEDKLAFAAIHLDDDILNTGLDRLLSELEADHRPLSALLITGLDDHPDCHKMIHRYIDTTHDIQTASILLVIGNCFRKSKMLNDMSLVGVKVADLLTKAFDAEPVRNARRQSLHCVRDYMELMNNWSFWLQKTFLASFLRSKSNTVDTEGQPRKIAAQAIIACNFCGMPIYPSTLGKIESLRQSNTSSAILDFPRRGDKTRMMSCVRCRKPLPKCTICRRHFGSQAEAISTGNDTYPSVHSPIDHWFVWCCNCNHGGHLSHIRSWFHEYAICPASGCDCLCMDRDQQLRDELFVHAKVVDEVVSAENLDDPLNRHKIAQNFL